MNLNTAILKNSLHKFIAEAEDEQILKNLQAYVMTLKDTKNDWWNSLSENDKVQINQGIEQLDKGLRVPNKEVKRKADQILGK